MNSFEAFNLPTATFDDMRLMTAINTIAERQTGMSDPAMQGTTRELIRTQYSRVGEAIASLYQQFETNEDGKLQRVLGNADAGRVEEFLFPTDPVSGTLTFDVSAMAGSNTPDAEMKRSILVSQMNQNYWLLVIRGLSFLENPQVGPLVKEGVIGGIRAATKSHLRFLEAGDIDDLERYVLKLAENEQSGEDDLRTAAGRAGEIAASRANVPQPGVGGNGVAPPGGAAGPPGILGGLQ
jgi:hypothetical protein